jgi:hypothetical protein
MCVPIGGQKGVGFRPYALAGLGVIRSNVDALGNVVGSDDNQAAWDFGGGAMFFFANHVGVRGEVRYFQAFQVLDFINRPNPPVLGLSEPRPAPFCDSEVVLSTGIEARVPRASSLPQHE